MELTNITINNRYRLTKKLSEGSFSDYYEAVPSDSIPPKVVVRVINDSGNAASDEEIIKIRHDLRIVASLNHQNIMKIFEFGEIFKLPYIVMEYAPGKRLFSFLKENEISLEQSVDIITQITRGLVALHQSGVIHRGLNPDMVHICRRQSNGGIIVKLKDIYYPQVMDIKEQEIQNDDSPDYFEYFSPEQLNPNIDLIDHRSDLYSLGVIFYRLVTGRFPYSAYELLISTHNENPPVPEKPGAFNTNIDSTIDSIILKLISIDRDQRYSTAAALLNDLEKYARGERDFTPEISIYGFRQDYQAEFTGRKNEYDRLMELYTYANEVHGCACFICGESGIGKTRLVSEFLNAATMENAVVITGKCASGVSKEPYGLIKEFLNSYIEIFNGHSELEKEEIRKTLKNSLGILGDVILKLNHNMADILGEFPELVPINPEYENKRFHSVAGDFFLKLAAIEKPVILVADDFQWIDEGSLELIERIYSGIENTSLFLIGIHHNDDSPGRPDFFRFIGNNESESENTFSINMKPIDIADTERIISSILYNCDNIIDELTGFIFTKSGGNPLFTIEILRGFINEKVLKYTPSGWELDSQSLDLIRIPKSITDIMIKKASLLGEMESLVLSHASLIGHVFEYDLLSCLFNPPLNEKLTAILDSCVDMQLIFRDTKKKGRYHFVHDRVREALSSHIPSEEKKIIHFKIASTLETIYQGRIHEGLFDIANHYIECGESEKILEYAVPAAKTASESFANQEAIRYYSIVIEILHNKQGSEDLELRITAETGLAKVYLRTGQYDESINILIRLIPYISNPEEKVLPYSMISTAYFKKGDLKLCEVFARIGIEEIGEKLPSTRRSLFISLIKEIYLHFFLASLPLSFLKIYNRKSRITSREKAFVLYESLSLMYALKNRHKYIWVTLKILNIVESNPEENETDIRAFCAYGLMLSIIGLFKPALKYLDRSHDIAIKINNPYFIALTSMYLGNLYEWQGDFNKSIGYYNHALNYFERIGNSTGIGFVINGLASCYLNMAELEKLSEMSDRYYNLSIDTQNNYMTCNALIYKSLYYISTGNFDMAMIHAHKAHNMSTDCGIQMALCISDYIIATVYYYKNELDKAVYYYELSVTLYEKYGFIKYYTCQVYALLVEALIALYRTSKNMPESEMQDLLLKIKKYTRLALKSTKKWPTLYQYALLSAAKYYALTGKKQKAEKYFNKSIILSDRIGMKFESARSTYEYGLFLLDNGNQSKAKRDLEFSYNTFKEIGSDFYAGKVKKLLGLKNTGRGTHKIKQIVYRKKLELMDTLILDISQITENDKIFNEFVRNAAFIAGVYLGTMYIFDDEKNPEIIASYGKFNFDRHELYKTASDAFHSGMPVMTRSSGKNTASFLFLPIKHHGKTISVCAFGTEALNNGFSEEDEKLLSTFVNRISWLLNFILDHYRNNLRGDETRLKVSTANEEKIKKVITYIRENYMFDISREGLAALIDSNPDYFGRSFKLYTGMKINEYINKVRIEEAARKLTDTDNKIIDIALSVGFENLGTFNSAFLKIMKVIPSKYRKQKVHA